MHEGGILGWKHRELGPGERPSFHLPLEAEPDLVSGADPILFICPALLLSFGDCASERTNIFPLSVIPVPSEAFFSF